MANIYTKYVSETGAYLDKMVILNPREALIYPFDLGNWQELGIGIGFSATSVSSNNGLITSEALISNTASNSVWLGLLGWTGDIQNFYGLPEPKINGTSGNKNVFFLGQTSFGITDGTTTNTASTVYTTLTTFRYAGIAGKQNSTIYKFTGTCITSEGDKAGLDRLSSSECMIALPNSNIMTGNTGFIGIYPMRIKLTTGYRFEIYAPNYVDFGGYAKPTFTTDSSIETIRGVVASMSTALTASTTNAFSGFYTNNGTNNSNRGPIPSGLLIYFPYLNNRIRIHGISIEKYA